jgi:hypothetical protein
MQPIVKYRVPKNASNKYSINYSNILITRMLAGAGAPQLATRDFRKRQCGRCCTARGYESPFSRAHLFSQLANKQSWGLTVLFKARIEETKVSIEEIRHEAFDFNRAVLEVQSWNCSIAFIFTCLVPRDRVDTRVLWLHWFNYLFLLFL